MAHISESLRATHLPPATIREAQIPAATPEAAVPDMRFDLSPAQELLTASLLFPFHHASGSYTLKLDYVHLVRRFHGIVRIPSPCCLDLLQGRAPQIVTHIEGRTRCKALLSQKEGLPHILAPLIDALIEAHYNQLEFALHTSNIKFKRLTGFRQVVEELRKNPKGYQLKKIVVLESIPWLKGRVLIKKELGQLRDALIPFHKRAPTEKELQDIACSLLFVPAVPDMFRFILEHATALEVVRPSFKLVPKSGQGEVLCDGYEIHCVDQLEHSHRLTLFEGYAPPSKAHFQKLCLELNAKDRFEMHATRLAQNDIRENCLRWIDLSNPSPDDWALHQAFQILGKLSASDQEEQCLLERMAQESDRDVSFSIFLSRSLRQAVRDCEMDPEQVSDFVLNTLLALPEWLFKQQEIGGLSDLIRTDSILEDILKGNVRLEVLKCILPLCLWSHPEARLLPHGRGFKIWVRHEGHSLLLRLSFSEALQGLARLHPLLSEEEQIVSRLRCKPKKQEELFDHLAAARTEAAEFAGHADPHVKGFAKEILLAGLDDAPEALFTLLQSLPDLLDGEKNPVERTQIVHLAMERMFTCFGKRFSLLKMAAFSTCLSRLSEGKQLSRSEMAQLLRKSLLAMEEPALGNIAMQLNSSEQVLQASPIMPNGLQDIIIQHTPAKKLEEVLSFIQELNRSVTADSAQEDAVFVDWMEKAADYAAPFLKGNKTLQEELLSLYRSARATIFTRQEPLKLVAALLSLSTPEAIDLAAEIGKERLANPLPADCENCYASLIGELCKREEEAAYAAAVTFFGDAALSQRLSPKRREELESMLVATRLVILSKSCSEALNPAVLLEVKRFLANPRPVEVRRKCLQAAMHYMARFFVLPDHQLQAFELACEGIKELEGEAYLLTTAKKQKTNNSWISRWVKSQEAQNASFEISPALFFRSFLAGYMSYIGERYCTESTMQKSLQGIVNLGNIQIEQKFGDLKIEAQGVEDYAFALQVLLEEVMKLSPKRFEFQNLALGVVFFSLKTVLDNPRGIDAQRVFSAVKAYAFWPMVTIPYLVNLHEHYLKTIVQRADERKLFRHAPLLRFQLHFLAGEPLHPQPVLPKSRFQVEVSAFLDKLLERKCHAEQVRQFHVLLRLTREFRLDHSFESQYQAFFAVMSQEQGWGRVKLLRLLCREAVEQSFEQGNSMNPVMEMAVPCLFDQWLSILSENPQPPPEDNDDLLDSVRIYIAELHEVWEVNCPKVVAERYRTVFFAFMDRRRKEIEAFNTNTPPVRMIDFCKKYYLEYEQWASSKKIKQTGERIAEEWAQVCSKVRVHIDTRSFEFAPEDEKQALLQRYVDVVEVGIRLMLGEEAYRLIVEGVFDAIESKRLYPMMNKEQIYHLFLILSQPTGKSSLSGEQREARAACVSKWITRLQALKVEAIDLACHNFLESNLAKEIFKQNPEQLAEIRKFYIKNH